MNIAGNDLQMWRRLLEVADDPWTYSLQWLPSLVFKDMVAAGV
jgi:hypothetical protein